MEIIGRPFYRCTVGCVEGVRLYKVVQLYIYTIYIALYTIYIYILHSTLVA